MFFVDWARQGGANGVDGDASARNASSYLVIRIFRLKRVRVLERAGLTIMRVFRCGF